MGDKRSGSNSPAAQATPRVSSSPPPVDLVPAEDLEDEVGDDGDSSLGSEAGTSTASVSASILEYRHIHGRTYHSDKFSMDYAFPNDEQQLESVDITHHYLTVLFDGSLFLAPIDSSVQKVLDIGTGSGIWAIDFADQFPGAEVIGTDLSPCQPKWVPPNVRFEVDDATQPWTWKTDDFDFIHIRYLFGAVADWTGLFKEAFRSCAPGGYVESVEADVHFCSDDGTIDLEPCLSTCTRLYEEGSKAIGRSFFINDLIPGAFKDAGFEDIATRDFKIPVGDWPKDPKLAEVGRFVKMTLENDLEGYTSMLWNQVLGWPKDEYHVFLMEIRKAIRNRKVHSYFRVRAVYGRKPQS